MSWWAQKSYVVVRRGQCSLKWYGPYVGGQKEMELSQRLLHGGDSGQEP